MGTVRLIYIYDLNTPHFTEQLYFPYRNIRPSFRTKQVRNWVYDKGLDSFSDMKDLPLVGKLTREYSHFQCELNCSIHHLTGVASKACRDVHNRVAQVSL
jgi:adenine C2-methylase RlmN of 23S rRNA A2503 and tRNA A37